MEDSLIEALSSFGFPVRRQGSLAPSEKYPPTFFTFWCNLEDAVFYDNDERFVAYIYDIYIYSSDPGKVYELLDSARKLLKSLNWIIMRRGFDAQSDEITHTGRGAEVCFIQTLEGE